MTKRGKGKEKKKPPRYERIQGILEQKAPKQRCIVFCLSYHIKGEGQLIEEWEKDGLAAPLFNRIKYLNQLTPFEAKQKGYIKEYHKVGFPPDSNFSHPKHVGDVTWAVMHLEHNSKEVVVGYIEDDVFYLIFLDKDHQFWPTILKNT